jgi:hypothetical protein
MNRLAAVLLVGAAAVALSGCPSNTVKEGAKAAAAPVPGATDNLNATTAMCVAERDMMETAVEAFTLLKGAAPTSEAEMVPDWMRSESPYMDLDATGSVIPAPGSGCT